MGRKRKCANFFYSFECFILLLCYFRKKITVSVVKKSFKLFKLCYSMEIIFDLAGCFWWHFLSPTAQAAHFEHFIVIFFVTECMCECMCLHIFKGIFSYELLSWNWWINKRELFKCLTKRWQQSIEKNGWVMKIMREQNYNNQEFVSDIILLYVF